METLKELQDLALENKAGDYEICLKIYDNLFELSLNKKVSKKEKVIACDYIEFIDQYFCKNINYACLTSDNDLYIDILKKAYELEVL